MFYCYIHTSNTTVVDHFCYFVLLSKPQPNLNITVGFDNKMTLQTPPPTPPQKLNVSNISALTDPILMKL